MGKKSRRLRTKNKDSGTLSSPRLNVNSLSPEAHSVMLHTLVSNHEYEKVLEAEIQWGSLVDCTEATIANVKILYCYGAAHLYIADGRKPLPYLKRSFDLINSNVDEQSRKELLKSSTTLNAAFYLGICYADMGDADEAMSNHLWICDHCAPESLPNGYLYCLCKCFTSNGSNQHTIDTVEPVLAHLEACNSYPDQIFILLSLVLAYKCDDEYLKGLPLCKQVLHLCNVAGSSDQMHMSMALYQLGSFEMALRNNDRAILHFKKYLELPMTGKFYCNIWEVLLLEALAKESKVNEEQAMEILDRAVANSNAKGSFGLFLQAGITFRSFGRWNDASYFFARAKGLDVETEENAVEALHYQNLAIQEEQSTYLEQYCSDTTLSNESRNTILQDLVDSCDPKVFLDTKSIYLKCGSQKMHYSRSKVLLYGSQVLYYSGNKEKAFTTLKEYLDWRVYECKSSCYSCKQRVRDGSVPFKCENCRVAVYCDRKHQALTWNRERICHRVSAPC